MALKVVNKKRWLVFVPVTSRAIYVQMASWLLHIATPPCPFSQSCFSGKWPQNERKLTLEGPIFIHFPLNHDYGRKGNCSNIFPEWFGPILQVGSPRLYWKYHFFAKLGCVLVGDLFKRIFRDPMKIHIAIFHHHFFRENFLTTFFGNASVRVAKFQDKWEPFLFGDIKFDFPKRYGPGDSMWPFQLDVT